MWTPVRLEAVGVEGEAMVRQLTTKAQVNGYRFVLRRLEHALVRRDVRMLHDPMRSHVHALVAGAVIGLLVLGGFGVCGLLRPTGSVGDAKILVSKDAGALYVLLEHTVHPVLNLASARLITGSAETPRSVSAAKLAGYPRGPMLGIPGAPGALPPSAHPGVSAWTVCDTMSETPGAAGTSIRQTVIGERPRVIQGVDVVAGEDDAVLVSHGGTIFVIYPIERGGRQVWVRAAVDVASVPVMRALRLDEARPRPVSAGLLNGFPETDMLTAPRIDNAGAPGPAGLRVGSVVKTVSVDDRMSYFVVLADGVQPIGEVAAEIVRLTQPDAAAPVPTLSPGRMAVAPRITRLPVSEFPAHAPHFADQTRFPTWCRMWSRDSRRPGAAMQALLLGSRLPLSEDAVPVALTTADGSGPAVDRFYLPPGSGEYVQATDDEPGHPQVRNRYYISDLGIRFGIEDSATAQILGLGSRPTLAPWSVLSLLVAGPNLSRNAALTSHDGIAPDTRGRTFTVPQN